MEYLSYNMTGKIRRKTKKNPSFSMPPISFIPLLPPYPIQFEILNLEKRQPKKKCKIEYINF